MNIGFDSLAMYGAGSKNRGIGNYTTDQICAMIDGDEENHYFFLNLLEDGALKTLLNHPERLTEVRIPMGRGNELLRKEYEAVLAAVVRRFLDEYEIDVFYITSPFDGSTGLYRKEWFEGVSVAATVYDIIPYVLREHYLGDPQMWEWYMERVEMLCWIDKLLVISQSVKDDLMSYLGFPAEQIEVIWGAASERFREIEVSAAEEAALRERFGLVDPFLMCTGGDDERKNIARLIEAYADLPREVIDAHQLAVVCKLQPLSVERYTELAERCGVKGRVVLTNFVSDEELLQLYNLCELVVFPSTYEGFGLPVTEAWACGKPVLTSNNSSLVQIAGDAAVLVDPWSTEDITRGLLEALTERDLGELAAMGKERLGLFNWQTVAEATRRYLCALPGRRRGEKRERIAFFTPLPPQRSGISDYSVDILWGLSAYFDIDVFIDDGYEPKTELPESVRIFPWQSYQGRRTIYKDTVWQTGNSIFHSYMWPLMRRYGGTLVLHDYNMHSVLRAQTVNIQNDPVIYSQYLAEDGYVWKHGQEELSLSEEVNAFLVNYADKIIVHSDEAKEKLLRRDIGRTVRRIYHYANIEPLPDGAAAREKLGMDANTLLFASFGFVHPTKRVLPLLRAFARFRQGEPRARYVFVGQMDSNLDEEFRQTVEELGLSDCVSVTGYTELDEFLLWLDAADVCFNLRWPYNGETSGSFMRMLAKGKCAVVNDIGSFAELPDESCFKLPSAESISSGAEEENILRAMEELGRNEEKRAAIGAAARRFAEEELALDVIAAQYADFIRSKGSEVITEELLSRLRSLTTDYSRNEYRALARTLAWIKG